MIQTGFESRVKVQQIVDNQLPNFILDESPNAVEFLKQYYISQEYQSGVTDIAENLDQYLKLDNLIPEVIVDSSYITSGISSTNDTIYVNTTKGFPQNYGLLKIDDEIITYTGSTVNSFTGCIRGFSGITSYHANLNQEELVFSESTSSSHITGSSIQNLSSLFLKEFYKKLKYTFTPGLEDIDFVPNLNVGNFIKESRSFYQSKGTDESFRILFNILYGVTPRVVNLEEFLIKPSAAEFVRREIAITERISGDPSKLVGQTIKKSTDEITSASVSEVEPFARNNKQYFKISLFVGYNDVSAVEGNFTITQSTKSIENVPIGSSVITVDSTVGFPENGKIVSGNNLITYQSKSINQFFGCIGIKEQISSTDDIRSDEIYYGYEDGDISKKVELRLTGVLSKFVQVSDTLNVSEGDIISVKNLGDLIKNPELNKSYKEIFSNSWIYNTSSRYQIEDISNFKLSSPIDKSSLKIGDRVEIVERNTNNVASSITNIAYISDIIFTENRVILNNLDFISVPGAEYDLRRRINTASSSIVPIEFGNNIIISDIQNLYTSENYAYIASNSLPSNNIGLSIPYAYQITKDIKTSFINDTVGTITDEVEDGNYSTIAFSNPAPFIDGDRIYYEPTESPLVGLETGSYYVKIQSTENNKIKLYSSRSFVGGSNYLTFGPSPGTHRFTLYSQRSGQIGGQKLFKKFPLSENLNNGLGQLTTPGSIGMLINGVEIFNYKSDDKIYYGPLQSIDILNGGINYDIINPPLVQISSGLGITALVQPVISGSIVNVVIDSQDYDINSIVSIGITGGNGSGGILEPILKKRIREILFDSRTTTNSGGISTSTGQLTFLNNHNLIDGQPVIYNSNGNSSIGIVGVTSSTLINNATYYAKIDNTTTVRLYQSTSDYSSGINTIKFSGYNNSGIHKFGTADYKNTISEIKVIDGGSGYTNRNLIVKQIGISTINHTISFQNHGFSDGDLVTYSYQTSSIGISTLSQYYVLKLDENYFRLCDAGIGGTYSSNYNRQKYINFTSTGSGYQYFSYPDISVYINYTSVGFGTTTQEYKTIIATPNVRGSIVDAYLYETGTGYGSTILNLERKPIITIKNGKDAQLKPVIVNGVIDSVNIQYGGLEYYSIPDIQVFDPTGAGSGAELRPIISDGQITDIKIISSGIGYSNSSSILVKSSGSNALLIGNIRSLTVNNNFRFEDEFLFETSNKLQYSICGYFDKLRESFNDDGTHISGIIGWAYDGNPIYGPYGYSDPEDENTTPKLATSGYILDINNITDRPNIFNGGFFVEDYIYTNSGDLDENNGRFAKTEDFPNGIYAYFATLESTTLKPQFPYFIGNKYRSNLLDENYTLDQSFDFNNSNLLRNTFPYKVSDNYAGNDFIIETNEITRQRSSIESVSIGNVDNFDIVNSGSNYSVNDTLNFNNTGTEGGGLIARISTINGKDIVDLNTSIQTYDNAIFTWGGDKEVKVSILPNHNLSNNDYVSISGFSDKLRKLNDFYQIGVSSYYSNLLKTIPSSSTVGLVTEIYVTQLPTSVSVGSSILIDSEILSVVEVFKDLNILKVERGSTGISHTSSTKINFIPDSFTISENIDYFESKVNNKVYFNPKQSVGVGTVTGITNSVTFQFGDSTLTRYIPTQSIYIENHPFTNNQQVTFTIGGTNTNIAISTSSTGNSFNLPQNLYVITKNKNTIGIKTTPNSSEVFFISNGSDSNDYSFQSVYTQITGNIKKIKSTISVSTYHELVSGDIVTLNIKPNLSVGIGTSISVNVKRDISTGNILINPISFNSSGINTTTDTITINSHNLNTGDKILYSANLVASGLSTGSYYVYKVNDNEIKLSETYVDCNSVPPTTVNITNTGGSNQNISLINPQIKSVSNNNLVFNLSDTSLSGYNLKIYYDQKFNNEFVSVATTSGFTLNTIGTIGVSTNAELIINYSTNLPNKLYYNLEKSGNINTSDEEVKNYSEILFVDSYYNSDYKISGIGSTTFDISLSKFPEKLKYSSSECDNISYATNSISAKGSINKLNIISGGTGYKKLPVLESINSFAGKDAYIIVKSSTIGNAKEVRIINEGFEYSSDKTLQPTAYISPLITIKNSNTIGEISVINGGKGYNNPPSIVIVNSTTRKKIDSGILDAKLSGNSISAVNILQEPKGLPEKEVSLFTINNSNGISIQQIQSSSSGIFTCFITTPILGFSTNPFNIGDKVFIEGIQKFSSDGSGFNSEDHGYQFFTVSDYSYNAGILDKVVLDISNLTNNTGIAKTIQDSFSNIIKSTDYPSFKVVQNLSSFNIGEKLISNNIERDLYIVNYDNTSIKVYGSYDLSLEEVISGKESGNVATIDSIKDNFGRFKVDYSIRKDLGWANNIGKLDEDNQVISDNDYYQNLSYTVKSPIEYKDLRTVVNNLVHTSGLKNFADTSITSTAISGISSSNATSITRDIIEENRVDTIYDFDLVKDIDIVETSSKYLRLKNKKLADYTQCKTNVVLKIDDIRTKFSNVDGEPSEFLNVLQLNSGTSYDNLLVRVSNIDNSKIQFVELVLLNDGSDIFLLEKASIINAGTGIANISGQEIGTFEIVVNNTNETYLRFIPTDPYNVDYDLKLINNRFNSTLPGIGTTSIGFIDLTGSNKTVPSGITTSIISVRSDKFTSLHVNSQVVDTITNDMNFAELYLTHDGTNTYISQYYFDSEYKTNNYSGNFIGSFGANIDISSGILSLNYNNSSSNNISIRSKIVGFGTTAVGTGTYRFKLPGQLNGFERTAIYTSNYSSSVSAASTTVVSLNKNDFNSVKSLVKVGNGSTSALHQIMLVQDTNNIYVQQSPFISVGSTNETSIFDSGGIGTFGGEYSGNNFILKFYPDSSITSKIDVLSFNECLYTSLDSANVPPNLEYGTISESIGVDYYNAVNGDRINRAEFDLTSNGYPIFAKTFDPSNSSVLSKTTGIFNIANHFFSNGEKLIYTPKSTFIGIGSVPVGIGLTLNSVGVTTTILPSDVYVIKLSDNTFKLSTRKDYALLGIGVTFTSNGQGNAHQLEMSKRNEKSIITIDNLVQYPLLYTPISYTLSGNGGQISIASTIFALSGISTISPKNILKIDNEYMEIINVGFGTTSIGPITNNGTICLVQVNRGFVGSAASSHTDSTEARIYKGSYNIVGNSIYFTESPRGNPQILKDSSNLTFETSDFTGRVFLRNDYTSNQVYDDISDQFTGIGRTFTLKVGGANTVGLGSTGGNGILFINSIFQTPTTKNNPENNFSIVENSISGISSVVFSGITSTNSLNIFTSEFDINQNQIPRGGIIISLDSSSGLGYAPLVGAEVTATVGSGGSITSVGLGIDDNLGSGYNGIVSIGVSVYESSHTGIAASIRASVTSGGSLSFNVINGGTGYTNPEVFVSRPSYNNLRVTGLSRLGIGTTTSTGVGLLLDVEVGASSTTGIGSTYHEVTKFSISRQGYSFKRGDVFEPVGLVTDSRLVSPLSKFKLTVIDTFTDSFAAWQFGEFDYIDSIKNYQDGIRTRFPLYYNSELLSFEIQEGSQVNLTNALLITINGIIQDPGVAYQFDGGTSFVFTTAPKSEDNVAIFFYRGTAGDDSQLITDLNETIKRGDIVRVLRNNDIVETISQKDRTIFDLSFSDKFETNLYSDEGVDEVNYKPLSWTKQKVDRKINGENVYKTRDSIESLVYPTAKIIKNFSTTDNELFVDNAQFFKYGTPTKFDALVINEISNTNVNQSVESITNISLVNGFSGIITGITTATGSGGNPLALKFYIEAPSGTLYSDLVVGYPIYIFDTCIGAGVTSINTSDSSVIGIGSTFLDNIYYIHQISSSGTTGIVTCNIKSNTSVIGLTSFSNISNPIGKFSWGRMSGFVRSNSPISIGVSGNTVDVGLSTFPTIQRRGTGLRNTGALPKLL
jgi:hypothetical protein